MDEEDFSVEISVEKLLDPLHGESKSSFSISG